MSEKISQKCSQLCGKCEKLIDSAELPIFFMVKMGNIQHTTNFEDLFRYNYRPLCLYALHYLQDVDLAEDIVQESYTIISITTIGEIINFRQINRDLPASHPRLDWGSKQYNSEEGF